MGKVADTERLKLRATFFNNLSVGLYLGGLLIPYLAVIQHTGDIITDLFQGKIFTRHDLFIGISALVAMGFAAWVAQNMRRYADETIAKIEDDGPKVEEQNSN
jgi:hypothetical protein